MQPKDGNHELHEADRAILAAFFAKYEEKRLPAEEVQELLHGILVKNRELYKAEGRDWDARCKAAQDDVLRELFIICSWATDRVELW